MNQVATIQTDFTPQQMDLITRTIAKGATPDELKLFLYRCKNMGLDPLKPGQIHFVKYGSSSAGSIVVGIEGFRVTAHRTGKLSGIKRGPIKGENGELLGAWAEVYRTDWTHPAREEVPLSEYDTGRGPWQKMPETMIKKVAEAAALRMAFPEALGGVYAQEEMDQADHGNTGLAPLRIDQPGPGDGHQHPGYHCPGHIDSRLANKPIDMCDPALLREVVENLEKKYADANRPIPAKAREFIREAERVIGAWENSPLDGEVVDE